MLAAFQNHAEREHVIESFTTNITSSMVIVGTYACASTGLDLQTRCWRVHLFELAHNTGISAQAIGRVRRLGNPSEVVFVYEYSVKDSFNEKQVMSNIEKAIPGAMAILNKRMFYNYDDEDDEEDVDLDDWILRDGRLILAQEVDYQKLGLKILSAEELITFILKRERGTSLSVG